MHPAIREEICEKLTRAGLARDNVQYYSATRAAESAQRARLEAAAHGLTHAVTLDDVAHWVERVGHTAHALYVVCVNVPSQGGTRPWADPTWSRPQWPAWPAFAGSGVQEKLDFLRQVWEAPCRNTCDGLLALSYVARDFGWAISVLRGLAVGYEEYADSYSSSSALYARLAGVDVTGIRVRA